MDKNSGNSFSASFKTVRVAQISSFFHLENINILKMDFNLNQLLLKQNKNQSIQITFLIYLIFSLIIYLNDIYLLDRWGKVKPYNNTTYAILGILTTDCTSGYSIKQFMDQSLNHFWKISYGQIYPTLKLLVEDGLAEVKSASTSGRSDKNEYLLTEKGLMTLKNWIEQPIDQVPAERNEVLLKLFFGAHQSHDHTISLLEDYRKTLESRYATYEVIEQGISHNHHEQKDAMYWLFTLDYGKRVTKAALEWCEYTLKKVQ